MIPFQSQIISGIAGASIAAYAMYSYIDTKCDLALAKVTVASQATQAQAQTKVQEKTEKATEITVDNTAQLQKELLNAKDQIAALHRGINNGTLGMRINVISPSSANQGVQSSSNTPAVPAVTSAELDRETASALVDITATGDDYARQYNSLRNWCEAQLKLQGQ